MNAEAEKTEIPLAGYFLVGPTASGKTAVAQLIAEQHDFSILSADSMLVYQDMTIGTAKPTPRETKFVAYSGINLVAPDKNFNTWDYRIHAIKALRENRKKNKTTIIVGGTGLYVKSLTDGFSELPDPDPEIRNYWMKIYQGKGVEYIADELHNKCPALYNAIEDKKNARRLIRAMELYAAGITSPPDNWTSKKESAPLIGLNMPREQLRTRIAGRVEQMYKSGLLDEMEEILKKYNKLSDTAAKAIGYAEAMAVINGELSVDEAKQLTVSRTNKLAKRQMTWFKKQANVKWVDINATDTVEEIAEQVMQLWSEYGKTEIR